MEWEKTDKTETAPRTEESENLKEPEILEEPGKQPDVRLEKRQSFWTGFMGGMVTAAVLVLAVQLAVRYLPSFFSGLTSGTDSGTSLNLDMNAVYSKISFLEELINEHYYGEVDSQNVQEYIYKGLVAGLDDIYAAYYTQEELARIEESNTGAYEGIGVNLSQNTLTGEITVAECYEGSPAAEAGLQAEDQIIAVNGQSVEGMELTAVSDLVRTAEGETVRITVIREGENDSLDIDVKRGQVELPTVESQMLENGTGYIKILEFDQVTVEQFRKAKEDLESQGMEALIIDLRDNPGGVLDSVCDILREILPEGLILYTETKDGEREEYYCDGENEIQIPLAVLVNENSASASEVFAGAVKDYGIGTLVGTTTFGKGIVQQIIRINDGTAVKLTIAKYFTPSGNNIHEIGIEPDVKVEAAWDTSQDEEVSMEEDNQLQTAIKVLEEE